MKTTNLIRLSDLSAEAQKAVLINVDRFVIWLEYKRESLARKAKRGKGMKRKKKKGAVHEL